MNYQRLYEASQRALSKVLTENRINAECLELAQAALRQYANGKTWRHFATDALEEIDSRQSTLPAPTDKERSK